MAIQEWQIQAHTVRELHRLGVMYHGDQNAGSRGFKSRAQAKATGMRKGWPDLTIVLPSRIVWIEFKTLKGRVSPDQKKLHEDLRLLGFEVYVVAAEDGDDGWLQVKGILGL